MDELVSLAQIGGRMMIRGRNQRWLVWPLIMALMACTRDELPSVDGVVRLSYFGKSDRGYLFELHNGSTDEIHFLGKGGLFATPTPSLSRYAISCRGALEGRVFGYAIQSDQDFRAIGVDSRHRLRLEIPGKDVGSEKKAERCKLELKLEDGEKIESDEFTP